MDEVEQNKDEILKMLVNSCIRKSDRAELKITVCKSLDHKVTGSQIHWDFKCHCIKFTGFQSHWFSNPPGLHRLHSLIIARLKPTTINCTNRYNILD